jgi:hypothetical protein
MSSLVLDPAAADKNAWRVHLKRPQKNTSPSARQRFNRRTFVVVGEHGLKAGDPFPWLYGDSEGWIVDRIEPEEIIAAFRRVE